MDRRTFLAMPAALLAQDRPEGRHYVQHSGSAGLQAGQGGRSAGLQASLDLRSIERERVLRAANRYLREKPVTITATSSPRSAGGRHDFFSEGDYWWPDLENPDGPYIQRDGETNPDNFVGHRKAMVRLSLQVPALVAAWKLTGEQRFAEHAARHLRAWFIDAGTLMNPHLLYAQAIKGRFTGRGIGIIDTLHLVEVARAASVLDTSDAMTPTDRAGVRKWFTSYLTWMTTHEYGIAERNARNNHGTCWVAQVAEFARYTGDASLMAFCRDRYKTVLVPVQMAADGSFPLELARTKPYGYSLFNLDAFAIVCQTLSEAADNLWTYELSDGRGMRKAMDFMFPYIADKSRWPHKPDVQYHENWPVRHPSLLFAGISFDRPAYLEVWRKLDGDPTVDEVIRNFVVRQPLLWISDDSAITVK
jgi:hypothetical protein